MFLAPASSSLLAALSRMEKWTSQQQGSEIPGLTEENWNKKPFHSHMTEPLNKRLAIAEFDSLTPFFKTRRGGYIHHSSESIVVDALRKNNIKSPGEN